MPTLLFPCPPMKYLLNTWTHVTPQFLHLSAYRFPSTEFPSWNSTQPSPLSEVFLLLLFNWPVVSDSLWPHGLQHSWPPCPLPSSEVCTSSRPLRFLIVIKDTHIQYLLATFYIYTTNVYLQCSYYNTRPQIIYALCIYITYILYKLHYYIHYMIIRSDQISRSVVSDSLRPHERSMPGLPVHHQLPESTQAHVHRVSDAIQPSHPL